MRKIQVGDLDGCIADDRWRRGLISSLPATRGPGWENKFDQYHEAGWKDRAMNLHEIREDCELVILTGRPLKYRELTMAWLQEVAAVPVLHVIFRNDNDFRTSVEIKRSQLAWLLGNYSIRKQDIVDAMDDRSDIVQMYRDEGLPARVVRIGAVCEGAWRTDHGDLWYCRCGAQSPAVCRGGEHAHG